jgi:hypothetical protein
MGVDGTDPFNAASAGDPSTRGNKNSPTENGSFQADPGADPNQRDFVHRMTRKRCAKCLFMAAPPQFQAPRRLACERQSGVFSSSGSTLARVAG